MTPFWLALWNSFIAISSFYVGMAMGRNDLTWWRKKK